jgi:hypothetical protein
MDQQPAGTRAPATGSVGTDLAGYTPIADLSWRTPVSREGSHSTIELVRTAQKKSIFAATRQIVLEAVKSFKNIGLWPVAIFFHLVPPVPAARVSTDFSAFVQLARIYH